MPPPHPTTLLLPTPLGTWALSCPYPLNRLHDRCADRSWDPDPFIGFPTLRHQPPPTPLTPHPTTSNLHSMKGCEAASLN